MTSYAEGSPKALLEAMSLGLVPIVTKFDTSSEVIKNGKNGFITEYSDKEIANKLKILTTNKILSKKMSENAIKTIKEKFNLSKQL